MCRVNSAEPSRGFRRVFTAFCLLSSVSCLLPAPAWAVQSCAQSAAFAINNASSQTIPPIGQMTLTADVVTRVNDSTWQASGNVKINNVLRCTGTVTANTATLMLNGNGEIWIDNVPLLGNVRVYSGSWQFDGNKAATTSINTFFSSLDLAGMTIRCTRIGLVGSAVHLEGYIQLPADLGGTRIDITNPHFIELSLSTGLTYDLTVNTNADLNINGFKFKATNSQIYLSNVGGTGICEIYGVYQLPLLGGTTVNLSKSEGRYFWIRDGVNGTEWDLNGSLYIGRVDIVPPSIYAKDLYADVNVGEKNVYGEATVGFPAGNTHVEILGTLSILGGYFDSASLDASFDPAIAILTLYGVPVVSLDSAGISVENMSPASARLGKSVTIEGSLGLVGGPEFNGYSLVEADLWAQVDLAGEFHGTGNVRVGNYGDGSSILTGTATVDVYLDKGLLITGDLSAYYREEAFLILNGAMAIDAKRNFAGRLSGTIIIPRSAPVIGAIAGGASASAEAYAQSSPDGNDSNDYLAAGFSVDAPIVGRLSHVIEVSLADGDIDWTSSWDRIKEVQLLSAPAGGPRPLGPSAPQPFEVAPGVEYVIFRATWGIGQTELHLQTPDGQVVTPQNVAAFSNMEYYSNTDPLESFYIIASPAAGTWELVLSESDGIGEYTLQHLQQSLRPTIAVTAPAVDTLDEQVTIGWTAVDTDDDAMISLYYDTDRQGADGNLIIAGLSEDSQSAYAWSTTGMPVGNYYVYAIISDGKNVPVISYSVGRVMVTDPLAPGAPTGLGAAMGISPGQVVVNWAPPAQEVHHYEVKLNPDPAGESYSISQSAGTQTQALLDGLLPGGSYRVTVEAIGPDDHRGLAAEPILVTAWSNTNNMPAFAGSIPTHATAEMLYQYPVSAVDLDRHLIEFGLSGQPAGMTISATGLLNWTPTSVQVGTHTFMITLDDLHGGITSQAFTIHVSESGATGWPPEIFSHAVPEVAPGGTYTYPVLASDPDAGDNLIYNLLTGPAGAGIDDNGVVTWTASTVSGWYDFVVKVSYPDGRFDLQRFAVLVDAEPPQINPADWAEVTLISADSVELQAKPAPDASGPIQFQFEQDGIPGSWQDSALFSVSGLLPNTCHTFGVKVRDRAVTQHESAWSDEIIVCTLAEVPPAPILAGADLNSLSVQVSAGTTSPVSTELALFNASDETWIDLDGTSSPAPVWATSATWGTVTVSGLAFDRTYHLQVKARNDDGVETELGPILEAKTAAPDAYASVTADRDWLYPNQPGSTSRQVGLSAVFANDPFANSGYTYTWETHVASETQTELILLSGGGLDDAFAVYAAPTVATEQTVSYLVTCTITGVPEGNSVSRTLLIEVRPPIATDVDEDGDVDTDDFAIFERCASGPGISLALDCEASDFDADNDVDQVDFAIFQRCFSGKDIAADPNCSQ